MSNRFREGKTERKIMHSFVLQVNAINYVLLPLLFRSLHTLFVSSVHNVFSSLSLSPSLCLSFHALNQTLFSRIISLAVFSMFVFLRLLSGLLWCHRHFTRTQYVAGAHSKWNGELKFSCVNINS